MLSGAVCPIRCDLGRLDLTEILRAFVRDRGDAFRNQARFVPGDDYHRDLVYATREVELWLISWLPGQVSPIHDHGGVATVTTVLSGTVFEERFERTSDLVVRPTWTTLRMAGEIDPIDPTEIHRVTPIGPAVSLHLYAPTCPEGRIYQAAA